MKRLVTLLACLWCLCVAGQDAAQPPTLVSATVIADALPVGFAHTRR
jgi:hypothetical protein